MSERRKFGSRENVRSDKWAHAMRREGRKTKRKCWKMRGEVAEKDATGTG